MVYKVSDDGWDSTQEQAWDEMEAVRLLRHAGEVVALFEATGARVPQRELYHARLIAAHEARDVDAYRMALNGYTEAARLASLQASREAACRKVK